MRYGLMALCLALALTALPAAAATSVTSSIPSEKIVHPGSQATGKVYQGDINELGPVPTKESLEPTDQLDS